MDDIIAASTDFCH